MWVRGRWQSALVVPTKFNRDSWGRLWTLAVLVFGVVITFTWMALLVYGFAALISWAI